MKKIILLAMLLFVFGSTACTNTITETEKSNNVQQETVNKEK